MLINRKSYYYKHKSFYVDPYKIDFNDKKVRLEKIVNSQKPNRQVLNWINMAEKNRIPVGVKYYNPRVSYDGTNFFLTVSVDDEYAPVKKRNKVDDRVIGIDLNNKEIVTSENIRYPQPKKYLSYQIINKRRKKCSTMFKREN